MHIFVDIWNFPSNLLFNSKCCEDKKKNDEASDLLTKNKHFEIVFNAEPIICAINDTNTVTITFSHNTNDQHLVRMDE